MNSVATEIAAEPLLFSWDSPRAAKDDARGFPGAVADGTRPLLLCLPNCLPDSGSASAAAGPRHIYSARLRRRPLAASLD